jgi:hypothetical protein
VLGDHFTVFSAGSHTGNFTSVLGSPGAGLAYSFNPATGVVSVTAVPPQPHITSVYFSGTNLVLSGTNGLAGEQYYVLTTTNLTLPLNKWTLLPGGTFTGSSFNITNAVNVNAPRNFYMIQVP